MSSVLNFFPHMLMKCSSDFFFPHFCGGSVVGKGAEHNKLRAEIIFLALVSSRNATALSLLSQGPHGYQTEEVFISDLEESLFVSI